MEGVTDSRQVLVRIKKKSYIVKSVQRRDYLVKSYLRVKCISSERACVLRRNNKSVDSDSAANAATVSLGEVLP